MNDGRDVCDVVVVGGGHNGLVCATYLARAGLDVIVVEQADAAGGALMSSTWEGFTLEHGAVEHTGLLANGVLDELDLAAHGLRFATRTAGAVHLFGDGTRLVIEETAEDTAASIAEVSEPDAEAWLRLAALTAPLLRAIDLASAGWIPPPSVAGRFARTLAGGGAGELVAMTRSSVADLATTWFESAEVRAMAMFRACFSGLAPWSAGSAAAFLLTPAGHGRTFGRPLGGSRAVVMALESAAHAAGADVRCGWPVRRVRRDGVGWVVESSSGTSVAARRAVVSAMAPRPFLVDVREVALPSRTSRRLARVVETADNLSQVTLAAALDDAATLPALGRADLDAGALWLLPSPASATAAAAAALVGRVPDAPATLVVLPSRADPSAAPAGRATMWANAFVPRRLDGRPWSAARAEIAESVWRSIGSCLPDVRAGAVHEVLTTPDDLTARLGSDNAGNHVAPTPAQTLGHRPVAGLGNHRTPVDGLFLTGAGTHPGGGVSGTSGRACAGVVLDALGQGRSRSGRAMRLARQTVDAARAARVAGKGHAP